jgi:transcriptional regulator with XRE-family HTH domain
MLLAYSDKNSAERIIVKRWEQKMTMPSAESGGKTGSRALGDLIQRRRKELGLSRQELAERTGVPYPTLAQIETAYRKASPTRLRVIAEALGLSSADLFEVLTSGDLDGDEPTHTPHAPSAAPARVAGAWIANPAYLADKQIDASIPAVTGAADSDAVERVVGILSELPASERLDALARVQSRLLSGLVEDEVRRATRSRRGR